MDLNDKVETLNLTGLPEKMTQLIGVNQEIVRQFLTVEIFKALFTTDGLYCGDKSLNVDETMELAIQMYEKLKGRE